MLTATGTLTAAITSKERQPVHEVLTDPLRDGSWFMDPGVFRDVWSDTWEGVGDMGDLTRFVESVDLDESLATDLPAGARQGPGGMASAQATIVLAGALSGIPLAQAFSGFDNPLSVLAPRLGLPVTIALGMRGTAGEETLPQFTGKVRSCHVDPDAGTVTLTCLDNGERFRTPVALPVVFADDHGTSASTKRPGLNAGWLIDWIARQQGYFASPGRRTGCALLATMHGSAWPEVGTLTAAARFNGTPLLIGSALFDSTWASGIPGLQLDQPGSTTVVEYAPLTGMDDNQGSNVFTQMWISAAGDSQAVYINRVAGGNILSIEAFTSTATVHVTVQRGGSGLVTAIISTPLLTANAEHYLGVHVAWTAGGATINVRVDGTTYTGSLVVANPTGNGVYDRVAVAVGQRTTRDIQVTTEPYSAGMWDNAFVPTAILEPSLNELTSTPTVNTSDPWQLVFQIADAEQGIARFDGDVFTFRNRDFLTGGAAVATITTDGSISFANLKQSASSDEAIDTVNNVISGTAIPYTLDAASTVIWGLSEVMSVPAGATVSIPADFPGPVHTLASVTHRASQTADGAGGDITNLAVTWAPVTASSYVITVSNPNGFPAYIVGNLSGGTPGEPTLNVVGRCTRPSESPYLSVATDAASVALYGAQPLDLTENPFRQSAAAVSALTAALLGNLKDPHPEINDLEIAGDPRLQLCDRVRVADPDGLSLDDDFWAVARKTTYSASAGLAQSASLRKA